MDIKALGKQALSLDKMLVPVILLWIYRIGLAILALAMLISGLAAFGSSVFQGLLTILIGLPLSLVAWRVYIELVYVLFGIYKELNEINRNTNRQ